jgi:hypothetical protein
LAWCHVPGDDAKERLSVRCSMSLIFHGRLKPVPMVVDHSTSFAIRCLSRGLITWFQYNAAGFVETIHVAHESESPNWHPIAETFEQAYAWLDSYKAGKVVLS